MENKDDKENNNFEEFKNIEEKVNLGNEIKKENTYENEEKSQPVIDYTKKIKVKKKVFKKKNLFQIFVFTLFKIGASIHWSFIYNVLLPLQIVDMVSEKYKEVCLGAMEGIMNFLGLCTGVIVGWISDRVKLPFFGRRKPFIFGGCAVMLVCLICRNLLAVKDGGWGFFAGYALLTFLGEMSFACQDICYYGLIPECFPKEQLGLVSGMVSFADLSGVAIGIGFFGWFFKSMSAVLITLIIGTIIFVFCGSLIFFWEEAPRVITKTVWEYPKKKKLNVEIEDKEKLKNEDQEKLKNEEEFKIEENKNDEIENEEKEEEADVKNDENKDNEIKENVEIEQKNEKNNKDEPVEDLDEDLFDEEIKEKKRKEKEKKRPLVLKILFAILRPFIYVVVNIIRPFKSKNFSCLFVIVFIMGYSISSIENFILYFLRDVIGPSNYYLFGIKVASSPERAQSIIMMGLISTSLVSAIVGGILSDKIGCKIILLFDSFVFAILTALVIFLQNYTYLFIIAGCMGICLGSYISNGFSLVSKLMPGSTDIGKDFGIMGIAMALPVEIALPTTGFLITTGKLLREAGYFSFRNPGYYAQYIMCASCQAIAGLIIFFFIDEESINNQVSKNLKFAAKLQKLTERMKIEAEAKKNEREIKKDINDDELKIHEHDKDDELKSEDQNQEEEIKEEEKKEVIKDAREDNKKDLQVLQEIKKEEKIE